MEPKDEIKQRLDIAELIGEYLELKPAGSGSFKARCPFHSEKTASFYVSKSKQIWHCFGCNIGGDVFSFVMQMENIDFGEALLILGKKVGVEIKRFDSAETNERRRLIDINELASKYFHKVLMDSRAGARAKEYALKRGIMPELLDKFMIGFAPDSWNMAFDFLKSRGYGASEIENAGLAVKKKIGDGMFDRFRARLMIPLCDHNGNTVGFTGRVLPALSMAAQVGVQVGAPTAAPVSNRGAAGAAAFEGPKYMNSPETIIYKKKNILFGLNLAKVAIKEKQAAIIVEGNLDVIASHKAGVINVVASSGTALTLEQILLLKRYTNNLIFSFDQDMAGFRAAHRGISLALANDMSVSVVILPESAGKDPDEAVQKDPLIWQSAVMNPAPIMEFYFTSILKGKDLSKVEDRKAAGDFLCKEIGNMTDVIEIEFWLQRLSDTIKTPVEILRTKLRPSVSQSAVGTSGIGARAGAGAGDKRISSPAPKAPKAPLTTPAPETRQDKATQAVISIYINFPEHREFIKNAINVEDIENNAHRELYKNIIQNYNGVERIIDDKILLENTAITLYGDVLIDGQSKAEVRKHLEQNIEVLKQISSKNKRKKIEDAIREAENTGDVESVKKLLEQFNALK